MNQSFFKNINPLLDRVRKCFMIGGMKTPNTVQIHQSPHDMHLFFGMLSIEGPNCPGFNVDPKQFTDAIFDWVVEAILPQIPNEDYTSNKDQITVVDFAMAEQISKAAIKIHTHLMDVAQDIPEDEMAHKKARWGMQVVLPWVEAVCMANGEMELDEAETMRKQCGLDPRLSENDWDEYKEMEAN